MKKPQIKQDPLYQLLRDGNVAEFNKLKAAGQLGQFKKIFPMNTRPTQPLNGRMIGDL